MKKAQLGWEATGPCGSGFSGEVVDAIGYGNYYQRRKYLKGGGGAFVSKPGWWNKDDDAKATLFDGLHIAMQERQIIVRSKDLLRECNEYEWDKGKIIHRLTKSEQHDGKAHGDRVVAAGVAWLVLSDLRDVNVDMPEKEGEDAPYGSWLWREKRERAALRKWTDDEPQFTINDLLSYS
jgi:hypothetical protein